MTRETPQPGSTDRQRRADDQAYWAGQDAARSNTDTVPPADPLDWGEYAVQVVHDDYLECKRTDGDDVVGDSVNIAKDPDLRVSRYDGLTIDGLDYSYTGVQARTVTINGTSDSKDQVVIPKYHVPADGPAGFVGSVITAAPIPTRVRNDADSAYVYCQLREITQRAWANVEEA